MLLGGAYVGFRQSCDSWLNVARSYGADSVVAAYQQVLAGKAKPCHWPDHLSLGKAENRTVVLLPSFLTRSFGSLA